MKPRPPQALQGPRDQAESTCNKSQTWTLPGSKIPSNIRRSQDFKSCMRLSTKLNFRWMQNWASGVDGWTSSHLPSVNNAGRRGGRRQTEDSLGGSSFDWRGAWLTRASWERLPQGYHSSEIERRTRSGAFYQVCLRQLTRNYGQREYRCFVCGSWLIELAVRWARWP